MVSEDVNQRCRIGVSDVWWDVKVTCADSGVFCVQERTDQDHRISTRGCGIVEESVKWCVIEGLVGGIGARGNEYGERTGRRRVGVGRIEIASIVNIEFGGLDRKSVV